MTYFARINILTGKVDKVIVAEQDVINTFPDSDRWVETSPDIRGNFAGIGFIYDVDLDIFYPPAPAPSWEFNQETAGWDSPLPYPEVSGEEQYYWDEDAYQADNTTGWVLVE